MWNTTHGELVPSFLLPLIFFFKHLTLPFSPAAARTMKVAFVLVSIVSVASAFVSNVGRAGYFRTSELGMTAEEREVKDVKVGVIGCGRIGLVHLEAITKAPGVTPVIVSNPTVSKAEKGSSENVSLRCHNLILL